MVVELEGPVLVQVRLSDGRIARRHVDQLHPHVGEIEESPQIDGGDDAVEIGNFEPETHIPNTTPSSEPPPESTQDDQQVSESATQARPRHQPAMFYLTHT